MSYAGYKESVYGVLGEFHDEHHLLEAAKKVREAGFTKVDAYTPLPVHGLADVLGPEDHRIKWLIFLSGAAGVAVGLGLQYWVSVVAYPHNVGGKPLWSWPAFVPVTFECMVLFASFGAVLGMLGLNGLPKPYHPVFNTPNFDRASRDLFFLAIEAEDPKYDSAEARRILESAGASNVSEVSG